MFVINSFDKEVIHNLESLFEKINQEINHIRNIQNQFRKVKQNGDIFYDESYWEHEKWVKLYDKQLRYIDEMIEELTLYQNQSTH